MYDWPEIRTLTDSVWHHLRDGLRSHGVEAPDQLWRDADPMPLWRSSDLVLGQTCGLPYRRYLHDRVHLLGSPDYGLEGCPPGFYRSSWVVRASDPRTRLSEFADARFAFNDRGSQSGYAVRNGLKFKSEIETGSHRRSMVAIAEDRADIAAIDAVSWRLGNTHLDECADLRVLDWSPPTPGLPLICSRAQDTDLIGVSVRESFASLSAELAGILGIRGFVAFAPGDYGVAVADGPATG